MKNKPFKIAIASGKGGVGKTMLASSLAILFSQAKKKIVACDCDVDAPNLSIWLNETGRPEKTSKLSTLYKPKIDRKKCTNCGLCASNCRFNALSISKNKLKFNYFLCEGCGVCELICPNKAITLKPVNNGEIKIRKTKYSFPLISGHLLPGESNSGKVVVETKNKAEKYNYDIMIIDSAPGTGCPVIASLQDSNLVILITEPTPSAFSDLKKVIQTVEYFKLPYLVVINKWDINKKLSKKIEAEYNNKLLGKISYDQKIFQAISELIPIPESNLQAKNEIDLIFNKIKEKIKQNQYV